MENPVYLTVRQFVEKYKGQWPSESALRTLILDANWGMNKFQEAFLKIGKRVLIDENKFWECVKKNQKK